MKERPILFSGPMVRAILEGRKTQTRRVVKEQPPERYKDLYYECNWHGKVGPVGWFWSRSTSGAGAEQQDLLGINPCPHGTVGDRLWVRETFCQKFEDGRPVYNADGNLDCTCCYYRADGVDVRLCDDDGFSVFTKSGLEASPWKPSIHMPRWASRITLEITGVRVERLQDISERDAQAEGCERLELGPQQIGGIPVHPMTTSYVEAFQQLWSSINGPESWSANPWVWVIEFRRVSE